MSSGKAKALAKKALNEEEKDRRNAEEQERQQAKDWSVGAKDSSKAKALEDKEAEKRRKATEKAALEAQEAAENDGVKRVVKTKKKGKDDFDMLNAALASAPKTKAQKDAEAKQKADEERRRKEQEAREQKEARQRAEQEEIRKLAARGIVANHTDALLVPINNHQMEEEGDATGMDAAIGMLSESMGKSSMDSNNTKALYKKFYSDNLPLLREEHPGLKLSQYQERIFEMWKAAPENPNARKMAGSRDRWKQELREQEANAEEEA